jgi:mRNA-degrading endonuclease HigB of HigAB toxin-antitoxin module
MHIVTRKHLTEAEGQFPYAAKEIQAWFKVAAAARWKSLAAVRRVFNDADSVAGRVIFNIRQTAIGSSRSSTTPARSNADLRKDTSISGLS